MSATLSTLLFLLMTAIHRFTPCSAIDEQGRALLTWKIEYLNTSATDALISWSPSDPTPCSWVGIHCDPNSNVISISLKSVNLNGTLPVNLRPLRYLTNLTLSSANLTGVIPIGIGSYGNLELLDLSDNSIHGEIPRGIFNLTNLKSLNLEMNLLEGEIPKEMGNLSKLKKFSLHDNNLSGKIPNTVGLLNDLEIFRAGGNLHLKGEIPPEIGDCSNLVMLGLAETSISGRIPSSIGMLRRLQTLAIYTAQISGPIPDEIANCSALENLYLYQNSISGKLPVTIWGKLKKLQNLLLWQNSLAGVIPSSIGFSTQLEIIDLSDNLLTGAIPYSIGNLSNLQELHLSMNRLSDKIPVEITNCSFLFQLEVDNNDLSGEIPSLIGELKRLTVLFTWNNNLTGIIPQTISGCRELQALDLSYNYLFGSIPGTIFRLQNLKEILLISNSLSGFLPSEIGNCSSLFRLRLNQNRLGGTIPSEIWNLKRLNFLDLSNNHFVGAIPKEISRCQNLEFLAIRSNSLSGDLPFQLPRSLQYVDFSENQLSGNLSSGFISSLVKVSKLILGSNRFSGEIPDEIASCSMLMLLDFSNNGFSGKIPKELGFLPSLEISLNLSCNKFYGEIPSEFSRLGKLGSLDISHNNLFGNLSILAELPNLVSINISNNEFSGELPDTPLFKKLPTIYLAGNPLLQFSRPISQSKPVRMTKVELSVFISAILVLLIGAFYVSMKARLAMLRSREGGNWEVTVYQKLDFPIDIDFIIQNLTSCNVIGMGSSGVVYRVSISNSNILAVKKMWSEEESEAFGNEIRALGSIRHRNIVRLLGWGSNQRVKLLFYDYLPNGSLSSLLQAGKGGAEWERRYDVILGVAHALAYLHHDCVPPIMHGDVKAMNVLLGEKFEPYLADFGLARTVCGSTRSSKGDRRPAMAGSYGYMAPEHGSMQEITEKCDVYSYGVVLMEVVTGRHPLDPYLPGGAHLVQWVNDHVVSKQRDPVEILDEKMRGKINDDVQIQEMVQTLAVALLCVNRRSEDRPTMKDVAAMMEEIKHPDMCVAAMKGVGLIEGKIRERRDLSSCCSVFSGDSISSDLI